MKLSENIKALRKEHSMTQEQLAEVLGVTAASVSKWETAQTQPDLLILTEMAEYFAVSVDALIGHTIREDRITALAEEMKQLKEAGDTERAVQLAEKLLRGYPNALQALEEAESLHYQLFIQTSNRPMLERAIELLHRQLALLTDTQEAKRLELYGRLGNRYQLLGDWDRAEEYFRKGNVLGCNDSHLATLAARRGKSEEAVTALTEAISELVFELLMDLNELKDCYSNMKETEKEIAVLQWSGQLLCHSDPELAENNAILGMAMNLQLALLLEEQGQLQDAEQAIRRAAAFAGDCAPAGAPFLQPGAQKQTISGVSDKAALLINLLSQAEGARLLAIVRQALEE